MRTATLLALGLLGASTPAASQDLLHAAPDTVKFKIANERVRVLESKLMPGQKQAAHSHPAHLVYVLSPAPGELTLKFEDGMIRKIEVEQGDVVWSDGDAPHTAENTGNTPVQLVIIELKDGGIVAGIPAEPAPRSRQD